jgi:hypothetical protein
MFGQSRQIRFQFTFLRLLLLFLLVPVTMVFAGSTKVSSCLPAQIHIQHKMVVLNTDRRSSSSKIFFIHNISSDTIWLNHPQGRNPHAGAGWATQLQPNHWSALVLSENDFAIDCSMPGKRKLTYLNCSRVITICRTAVGISDISGNYWIAENKSWGKLIKTVMSKLKKANQ